jgi:hypothetical protein
MAVRRSSPLPCSPPASGKSCRAPRPVARRPGKRELRRRCCHSRRHSPHHFRSSHCRPWRSRSKCLRHYCHPNRCHRSHCWCCPRSHHPPLRRWSCWNLKWCLRPPPGSSQLPD